MTVPSASEAMALARSHLARAQSASWDPVDWADLSTYGFYCLEAAVMAAAAQLGIEVKRNHPDKARVAKLLAKGHGLPDVSDRLGQLNSARKAVAYGDSPFPSLDPAEVAYDVEAFVAAVSVLIPGADDDE